MTTKPTLLNRILSPIEWFARLESASGIILVIMTIVALAIANSPVSNDYFHLLETPISLGIGSTALTLSLSHWVSDGLMALFFFLVGLEIKREFISGELSTIKHAALPVFGALGGMVVPALIFTIFNSGTQNMSGWGIPMATDIAFALAVITLLGRRVPAPLKIFLIALAIIDDIGAVIVIALFYTRDINITMLVLGMSLLGGLLAGNFLGIRSRLFYALIGVVIWYAFLMSGVHATVAGVLVAFTVPGRPGLQGAAGESPLEGFVKLIGGFVAFVIMPVFVLTNAGVSLEGDMTSVVSSDLGLGIILGLVVGKPLGIFIFAFLSSKIGLSTVPVKTSWRQLFAVGLLGGIGFTMSLFITGLAFTTPDQIADAKLSIIAASFCASLLGWLAFAAAGRTSSAS